MKKALHGKEGVFRSLRQGTVSTWDAKDVEVLIEAANNALAFDDREESTYITQEEMFCYRTREYMRRLIDEGVTDDLINELNDELLDLPFQHQLSVSKGGTPTWLFFADFDEQSDPVLAAAYGFSHILAPGGLDNLKICQMPDCQRFFIGRPNAKWCSKSCGSRHRVRKKRKRDLR